jgi:hypothetical protein
VIDHAHAANAQNITFAFSVPTSGVSKKQAKTKTNLWDLDKQLKDLDLNSLSKTDAVKRISENHEIVNGILDPLIKLCSRLVACGVSSKEAELLRTVCGSFPLNETARLITRFSPQIKSNISGKYTKS